MNKTANTRIDVSRILVRILGDGPEAQRAFERITQRQRRRAKVDRLLRPWFRLRRTLQESFRRKGRDEQE
jgi:hypothetical protein